MKRIFQLSAALTLCFAMLTSDLSAQKHKGGWLQWSELPPLPDSLGLGGAFIGESNGVLIVAGGSNFKKPTWEGGEKMFHRAIFVLEKTVAGNYVWNNMGNLPYAVSNGACVTTTEGILCMGGTNGVNDLDKVIGIRWNSKDRKIEIDENYPPLPQGCSYLAATLSGNQVYVAGGKNAKHPEGMDNFWTLNLSQNNSPDFDWKILPGWPGADRSGAVLVSQRNGGYDCIYLFSGKSGANYLVDAYQYSPSKEDLQGRWMQKTDLPNAVMVAAATTFGQAHIICFSGSDGHDADKIAVLKERYEFSKAILAYNTLTDTWTQAGEMPVGLVTSNAIWWDGKWVFPGGEIGPSRRTNKVFAAQPEKPASEWP